MARLIFEGPKNIDIEPVIYNDNSVTALNFEYSPFSDKTNSQLKDKLKRTNGAEVLTSSGKVYKSNNRKITSGNTKYSTSQLRELFRKEICSEYFNAAEELKPDNTANEVPHIIDILGYDEESIEYFNEICPEKFSDTEIPKQDNKVNLSNIINSIINYKDTIRHHNDNNRHKKNLSTLQNYLNQ